MKQSRLNFWEGLLGIEAQLAKMSGSAFKAFNWDLAAEIINRTYAKHPDLVAEAGLQGDWAHTGGVIFIGGHAIIDSYTYLCSIWATPTLILSWDGEEQQEIPCFCEADERFNSDTKWDDISLKILGRNLKQL